MKLKFPGVLSSTNVLLLAAGVYLQSTSAASPLAVQSPLTSTEQPLIQPLAERIYGTEDYLGEGAWSPNGEYLAVAVNDTIVIFNRQLLEIAVLEGHTAQVNTVDWNADGTRLASGGDDNMIHIWNMEASDAFGTQVSALTGHTDRVVKLRYSSDDTMLASMAYDGDVNSTGELGYAFHVTWIWDLASSQVNHKLPRIADSLGLDWSLDSKYAINSGNDEGARVVYFWNTDTGAIDYVVADSTEMFVDVTMHPSGRFLAITNFSTPLLILDLTRSEAIPRFKTRRYSLYAFTRISGPYGGLLSWNPTGNLIAIGDKNGLLSVVDFATAQLIFSLPGSHEGEIKSMGWHPQSDFVFTVSDEDKAIRVWSFATLPDFSGTPTVTPVNYPSTNP
jgi:WD40 repeat protein